MVVLTILLTLLVVMLIMVMVLFIATGLTSLLSLIIPAIPLLAMLGSFVLALIELLLFFGNKDDRRLAKRELGYLGATFVVSGVLLWASTYLLWRV